MLSAAYNTQQQYYVAHTLVSRLFSSVLPAPTQPTWDRDEEKKKLKAAAAEAEAEESRDRSLVLASRAAPPYGKRRGWIPRVADDFGDGGAFPEIQVAQYPMGMGKPGSGGSAGGGSNSGSKALAVQLDGEGKVKYDLIARQGHGKDKVGNKIAFNGCYLVRV